jgi:hypothetical protein
VPVWSISPNGEVSEWLKEHAWKACVRRKAYRGFESRPLRHTTSDEKGDGNVTDRKAGTLEITAAILVLFTALLDPKISLVLAVAALVGLGLFHFLKKT